MKIKVERSGGIAGIPTTAEIDTKDLPSSLVNEVKRTIEHKRSPKLAKTLKKGAADHFSYIFSIEDKGEKTIFECNQYDIQNELKNLLKFIEKNSKFK